MWTHRDLREWWSSADAPARHMRTWLLVVCSLAVHVADEALTGFLDFYNPLALGIRARVPWWPMPTFRFEPWLAGLILLVTTLALAAPAVRRGAAGTRLASWVVAIVTFMNGVGQPRRLGILPALAARHHVGAIPPRRNRIARARHEGAVA